ncbi:MAG TPA: CDP-glycerol--glycerophosphate glycerophosphotransferase, partial [Ornithinibacter sp.]|nr:CDP-glycerol--glycerophosphate glycerophosphotransferase [Ornithinibacter sp.]
PLVVTRPAEPRAVLPDVGLVIELDLLDVVDAPRAAEVVDAAVAHPVETHAALVSRYFGDISPCASMERFLTACSTVVEERQAALVARASLTGH